MSEGADKFILVAVVRDAKLVECLVMRDTLLDRTIFMDRLPRGTEVWIMNSVEMPDAQQAAPLLLHQLVAIERDTADRFWSYVATVPRTWFAAAHHMGLRATRRMLRPPMRGKTSGGVWES